MDSEVTESNQATAAAAPDQPLGLTPRQEIVDVNIPAHQSDDLHVHIMAALTAKPAHRIVTMTMATYGEFPLHHRVLVVIEFL